MYQIDYLAADGARVQRVLHCPDVSRVVDSSVIHRPGCCRAGLPLLRITRIVLWAAMPRIAPRASDPELVGVVCISLPDHVD